MGGESGEDGVEVCVWGKPLEGHVPVVGFGEHGVFWNDVVRRRSVVGDWSDLYVLSSMLKGMAGPRSVQACWREMKGCWRKGPRVLGLKPMMLPFKHGIHL